MLFFDEISNASSWPLRIKFGRPSLCSHEDFFCVRKYFCKYLPSYTALAISTVFQSPDQTCFLSHQPSWVSPNVHASAFKGGIVLSETGLHLLVMENYRQLTCRRLRTRWFSKLLMKNATEFGYKKDKTFSEGYAQTPESGHWAWRSDHKSFQLGFMHYKFTVYLGQFIFRFVIFQTRSQTRQPFVRWFSVHVFPRNNKVWTDKWQLGFCSSISNSSLVRDPSQTKI